MEVNISVFTALMILFIINTIFDHLFNWWVREWADEEGLLAVPVFIYVIKLIIVGILLQILTT